MEIEGININGVFNDFQQTMRLMGRSLHILETIVPVEKQLEYFTYAERLRAHNGKDTVAQQIEALRASNSSFEQLKYALTYLATSGDVAAYRAIQEFANKKPDARLTDWTNLSLQQAKLMMNAEFLEENQVVISTGLGGKGSKFRFYAFFRSMCLKPFSDYQRKLIEKEFAFSIDRAGGEIEQMHIAENYFYILFLNEVTIDVRDVLFNAQLICNEFGDFLDHNFTLTNVKMFDDSEIRLAMREPMTRD
ncbi:hypothetical protein AGMMS49982_10000 [Bacteroidia bacterium]|nr:hypothetical protein AGMMS49982_10000 [Bacteroidia bacterium]